MSADVYADVSLEEDAEGPQDGPHLSGGLRVLGFSRGSGDDAGPREDVRT
jgi:hypothetical protein